MTMRLRILTGTPTALCMLRSLCSGRRYEQTMEGYLNNYREGSGRSMVQSWVKNDSSHMF